MAFKMEEGAGGLSTGKGVYQAQFVQLKPELHTSGKTGKPFAVAIFSTGEETAQYFMSPDSDLAYFVWQMCGSIAPPAVRGNEGAMFTFAQQELVGCTKEIWFRADDNGYMQDILPEPERAYICRYAGVTSRDENGLACDVPGKGMNETNRYVYFNGIVQDGPYAGWRLRHRVKAVYTFSRTAKGEIEINVSPKTVLGQVLVALGVTVENAQDWRFSDMENPWPTFDAALLKLAPTSPYKVFLNDAGYLDIYDKIKGVELSKYPTVIPDPLDTAAGGVATGDERQFMELLQIAAEIMDGQNGPIAVGLNLNKRGIDAGGKLFRPLLSLTSHLPKIISDRGSVTWPPSAWPAEALNDAIMVLTGLTANIKRAQAALPQGEEALRALVRANLEMDEEAGTPDVVQEMPF